MAMNALVKVAFTKTQTTHFVQPVTLNGKIRLIIQILKA